MEATNGAAGEEPIAAADEPIAVPPMDDVIRVGDLVVIMAEPGPFTVVEVEGPYVTIEAATGTRRKVRDIAVRKVTSDPPVAR